MFHQREQHNGDKSEIGDITVLPEDETARSGTSSAAFRGLPDSPGSTPAGEGCGDLPAESLATQCIVSVRGATNLVDDPRI